MPLKSIKSEGEFGYAKVVRYSPFVTIRRAALPTTCLLGSEEDQSFISIVHDVIEKCVLCKAETERLAETLHNTIYGMEKGEKKKKLLKFKRKLLKMKGSFDAGVLDELLDVELDNYEEISKQITLLKQNYQNYHQLTNDYIERKQFVGESFRKSIVASLENELFWGGLSVSSPQLANRLNSIDKRSMKSADYDILFKYLSRSAAKTSPFSSLTWTAVLLAEEDSNNALFSMPETPGHYFSINRGIPFLIAKSLAIHPRYRKELKYRVNPTLDIDDNGYGEGERKSLLIKRGSVWEENLKFRLRLNKIESNILKQDSLSYDDVISIVLSEGEDSNRAERMLSAMLRKDLLRPDIGYSCYDINTLEVLLNDLQAQGFSDQALLTKLTKLNENLLTLQHAPMDLKAKRLLMFSQEINSIFKDVDPTGKISRPNFDIYENVIGFDGRAKVNKGFIGVMNRMVTATSKRMTISPVYYWLRARFLEKFGENGVCDDVMGFINEAWQAYALFHQYIEHIDEVLEKDRFGGINTDYLTCYLNLYFQVVPDENGAIDSDDAMPVLNAAYNRINWQLSRFSLGEEMDSFVDSLQSWNQESHLARETIEVSVSSSCNNLQAHAKMTDKFIHFGGCKCEGAVSLQSLKLVHSAKSNMLLLVNADKQTVVDLTYHGSVNPSPILAQKYLLLALSEPVIMGRPKVKYIFAKDDGEPIQHRPRFVRDGCILLRETWWVKAKHLLESLDDEYPCHTLKLAEFLKQNNIPTASFVTGQHDADAIFNTEEKDKYRKPVWFSVDNDHCVTSLLKMASEVGWVIFREALPTVESSWLKNNEVPYVSEFMVEAVVEGEQALNVGVCLSNLNETEYSG